MPEAETVAAAMTAAAKAGAMAAVEPIAAERFRAIMRSFANSVTVITTGLGGHVHGMTATAIASVSADPPTVLVVLHKGTRTHPLVCSSRRFGINLLAEHQVELGVRFASKHDRPFDGVPHRLSGNGVPMLCGVLATLECETLQELDAGTHTIFVGRVLDGRSLGSAPLVYHAGGYAALTGRAAAAAA